VIASVAIDSVQFQQALAAGRKVGDGVPLTGLAAPLDATWLGKIAEAWDSVEDALQAAYRYGRDTARDLLDKAVVKAEELVQSAGKRAMDVQQAILGRVNEVVDSLINQALDRIRPTVLVGGRELSIQSVDIAQSVTMSGSLKVAITDLFTLTAEGQISVTANYGS
jgi:vacuolar-type H+-ATPase subunit H